MIAIYEYGTKGLEIVEPTKYLKNPSKYKFASLNQRLIANLKSKEAQKSQTGSVRPIPFDIYCPSMTEQIDKGICATCGSYWPSEAAKKRHFKACHGKNSAETLENYSSYIKERFVIENSDETCNCQANTEETANLEVITDLNKRLVSPFSSDDNY